MIGNPKGDYTIKTAIIISLYKTIEHGLNILVIIKQATDDAVVTNQNEVRIVYNSIKTNVVFYEGSLSCLAIGLGDKWIL